MCLFYLLIKKGRMIFDIHQVLKHFLPSFFLASNWLIFIYAVNEGHLLEVGLGYYLAPILSCGVGLFLFHEKVNLFKGLAIFLACVGVFYYSFSIGRFPTLAVSLAVTFVLYGASKKMVKTNPTESLLYESLALFPIALAYAFLKEKNISMVELTWSQETLVAISGIVTVVPLIWFSRAAKLLEFNVLGFFQYIGPTTNFFLALFVFKENCSSEKMVTFIFVWSAVLIFIFSHKLSFRLDEWRSNFLEKVS